MDDKRKGANEDERCSFETEAFVERVTSTQLTRVADDGLGQRWRLWKRRRYIVVVMVFLGDATKAVLRTNLSVAALAMTENRTFTDGNGTVTYVQDFDWDAKTRGLVLSVFFYGLVSSQMAGGLLSVKCGGCRLYGLSLLITSITTLLTPVAANIHLYVLISLRIFEGICEGLMAPSQELMLSRWIPFEERSSLVAVVATGSSWGDMASTALCSAIGHYWGWPAIFYCTGCVGIVWYCAFWAFVKEHPALDTKMSISELVYIQNSLGRMQENVKKLSSIPFLRMFSSGPVLALLFPFFAFSWSYNTLITQVPAYVQDVLKLDSHSSGYLSSIPLAVKVMAIYIVCPLADCITRKHILTVTATRKLYFCGSLAAMAVSGFLIQQATSKTAVLGCLLVMHICVGIIFVQMIVNIMDIAPRYSSVLAGLLQTASLLFGMFAPAVAGYLTQNKTPEEWHTVFYAVAGICLLGATMYGLLGSGELQPWAIQKNKLLRPG